ncbi:MAG: hypothetical protein ACJAYG_001194 [Oceanicoccus sp.]
MSGESRGIGRVIEELSAIGTVYGTSVDAADYKAVEQWVVKAAEQLGGILLRVAHDFIF